MVEVEGAAVEAAASGVLSTVRVVDWGSLAEISILNAASKLTPPEEQQKNKFREPTKE